MGLQINIQRYDVQVLGRHFHFAGQMAPVGRLMDYLNGGGRTTFALHDVQITPFEPVGPLTGIARPEIIVGERELGLIYFLDADYRQQIQVLKQFDRVIVYTPHAVLRGNFHRGAEVRLGDLFDMMDGAFLAMTDVNVFPLAALPGPFPQQTDVLIVNRHHVDFYHPQ